MIVVISNKKMARSHHRKKHKEHVRQFRHSHEATSASPRTKGKASLVFALGGTVAGLLVSYFASDGSLVWMTAGLAAGAIAGYFLGRKIDADK
jgi:hypothetical protein